MKLPPGREGFLAREPLAKPLQVFQNQLGIPSKHINKVNKGSKVITQVCQKQRFRLTKKNGDEIHLLHQFLHKRGKAI